MKNIIKKCITCFTCLLTAMSFTTPIIAASTPVFGGKYKHGVGNVTVYIDNASGAGYWEVYMKGGVNNWMYPGSGMSNPIYMQFVSSNYGSKMDFYCKPNSYWVIMFLQKHCSMMAIQDCILLKTIQYVGNLRTFILTMIISGVHLFPTNRHRERSFMKWATHSGWLTTILTLTALCARLHPEGKFKVSRPLTIMPSTQNIRRIDYENHC